MASDLYDRIGVTYPVTRRADPRLATLISAGIGDAVSVVNVGAGVGAYEPSDRQVIAVEPSAVMIAHRPADAARAVQAHAEALPFPDDSFDVAMAVLSDHHWRDRSRGLRELRRVARRRVVLFNANPAQATRFWFTTEYLPGFLDLLAARERLAGAWRKGLERELGAVRLVSAPIPHDCADGFYGAFWRRPAAYLDPNVRAGISVFSAVDDHIVDHAIQALSADLRSGVWRTRHRDLLALAELDLGYYVVIAELS